jgi:hypothetical protein
VDGQIRARWKRQSLAKDFVLGWRRSMQDEREIAYRLGMAAPTQEHICETQPTHEKPRDVLVVDVR